jgi:hypothetical protein
MVVMVSLYLAFAFSPDRFELSNNKASVLSENIKLYHKAAIDEVVANAQLSGSVDGLFSSGPFKVQANWQTEVFSSSDGSETVLATYVRPTGTNADSGLLAYDEAARRAFSELSSIGTVEGYQSYAGTYEQNENMWFGGTVGGRTFSNIPINIPDNSPVIITYLGDLTTI